MGLPRIPGADVDAGAEPAGRVQDARHAHGGAHRPQMGPAASNPDGLPRLAGTTFPGGSRGALRFIVWAGCYRLYCCLPLVIGWAGSHSVVERYARTGGSSHRGRRLSHGSTRRCCQPNDCLASLIATLNSRASIVGLAIMHPLCRLLQVEAWMHFDGNMGQLRKPRESRLVIGRLPRMIRGDGDDRDLQPRR